MLSKVRSWLSSRGGAAPGALLGLRERNPAAVYPSGERRAASAWPGAGEEIAAAAPRLTGCRNWIYQLQSINWERIEASVADVAVIDAAPGERDEDMFPAGVIERMRTKPGGGDTAVLCYLSIGAAEPWRGYWSQKWNRARPGWMDDAPSAWRGARRVHYWDQRWQNLMIDEPGSRLQRIVTQGFDGVVLDGIDSFEHYRALGRASAADEMIELVARIGAAAWRTNPNFMIVPVNGEELLAAPRYRSVISAVVRESVLYLPAEGGEAPPADRPSQDIARILDDLRPARAEGIPVLAVEYLRDPPADPVRIAETARRLRNMGLVPYVAGRRLDRLYPAV